MVVIVTIAGKCRGRRAGLLQRSNFFPVPGGDDEVGEGEERPRGCIDLPHPTGATAGLLHRGEKRLHRNQVPLIPSLR